MSRVAVRRVALDRMSADRVGSSRVSTGRVGEDRVSVGRVGGRQMLLEYWCGFAGQTEGNHHSLRSGGGVWPLNRTMQAGL